MDIIKGLNYLHTLDIIHGDVKGVIICIAYYTSLPCSPSIIHQGQHPDITFGTSLPRGLRPLDNHKFECQNRDTDLDRERWWHDQVASSRIAT